MTSAAPVDQGAEQAGKAPVGVAAPVKRDERLLELDSLRGVAACVVMLYHYTERYPQMKEMELSDGAGWAKKLWFTVPWGNMGVQLFFIISGFVILMTVERAKSLGGFAVQRFARLFPAFWVACVVTWLVVHFSGLPGREVRLPWAWWNVTMVPRLPKYFGYGSWYIDGVYWSLGWELLFYAVMAVALATGLKRHALWFVAGLVALDVVLMAVSPSVGEYLALHPKSRMADFMEGLPLRWFSLFAMGMVVYDAKKGFHWKHGVVLALALFDVWYRARVVKTDNANTWLYLYFVVGSLGLVALAAWARPFFLRFPPLVYLGTISYSLYLLHQNIGYAVIRWMHERGAGVNLAVGVAMVVAVGLASAMAFGVEKPVMRWVKKMTKRKVQEQRS